MENLEFNQEILKQVDVYFAEKIQKFGATHWGVDWNSDESQCLRFEQLTKIVTKSDEPFSICDFGCGYGRYSQ